MGLGGFGIGLVAGVLRHLRNLAIAIGEVATGVPTSYRNSPAMKWPDLSLCLLVLLSWTGVVTKAWETLLAWEMRWL